MFYISIKCRVCVCICFEWMERLTKCTALLFESFYKIHAGIYLLFWRVSRRCCCTARAIVIISVTWYLSRFIDIFFVLFYVYTPNACIETRWFSLCFVCKYDTIRHITNICGNCNKTYMVKTVECRKIIQINEWKWTYCVAKGCSKHENKPTRLHKPTWDSRKWNC